MCKPPNTMEIEDNAPQRGTCGRFCAKYFCEGQTLDKDYEAKLKAGRVDWTVRAPRGNATRVEE